MSADLCADFPAARRALDEVDEALGRRLSRDMHSRAPDAAERLARTETAQPALLAHAAAALFALRAELGTDAGAAGAAVTTAATAAGDGDGGLLLGPLRIACVLGHSVGEVSALVAAGALSLGAAARVLRLRARCMQRAADDDAAARAAGERGMLALIFAAPPANEGGAGKADEQEGGAATHLRASVLELERCCREASIAGAVAAVAAVNSPQQVVLSGDVAALEAAVAAYRIRCVAQERRAPSPSPAPPAPSLLALRRTLRLPVGAPFHCAIMAPAAEALRRAGFAHDTDAGTTALAGAPLSSAGDEDGVAATAAAAARALAAPRVPLVSNVDARPHAAPGELRGLLADGLTRPVRFAEGALAARALGAAHFLELGGGALTPFARQTLVAGSAGAGDVGNGGGGGGSAAFFSVGTSAELRAYVRALDAAERGGG